MPRKSVKTKKKSKVAKKSVAKKSVTKKSVSKATKKVKRTKKTAVVAPQVTPVVPEAPAAAPVVPVAPPVPVKTEAEKIWDEIRELPIEMFGLPNQIVSQYCTFANVEPTHLYVTIRTSATLPSLEAAIAKHHFVVEVVDKFVVVKRAPKPLTAKR